MFSGHLVDAPERAKPRLPNDTASIAAAQRAIDATLAALGAGPGDLALTQGACGGDLLFTTACVGRGVETRWLQPYAEADFISRSVAPGGEKWLARYVSLRARLSRPPQAMPASLGAAIDDTTNPYRRCNRWLLDTAASYGLDRVQIICLFDGERADEDGGTAAMLEDARRMTSHVTVIDAQAL